ncbi:MAG: FG-GAP-like repeat-containing protein, partial [Thermoplasmata archaeon]
MNEGNASIANWALQQTLFEGIDVGGYAAPALADLNDDGDLDMISGENNGSLFYYQNTGTIISPVWSQDSFIHRLSSLGVRAVPEFADLDADGDLDLTVGLADGTLRHFENAGLPNLASWLEDSGLFSGMDVGNFNAPAFGDLDDDNDFDLALGKEDGTLVYYENAGTNVSASWTLNASMFPGIDVGDNSAPELVDMDTDGDLDLVVGNATGCVHLYRNTGTVSQPSWAYDPLVFDFMNTGLSKKPGQYATPVFSDVDGDGDLDFISGPDNAAFGSLVLYFNTGTRFSPVYDQLYPGMFNNVRGGATDGTRDHSAPEFVDLDGDGREDIAVGTNDGWLTFYRNTGNSSAQRSVNYMEPQKDGSYRFYYDQDGNDGQFVIRGTSDDFFDYYVMANPNTGRATMRFIPDFARLAYRDKYSGDQYPWAGGNVSYYPFIPEEDGYVGRAIVISRAQAGLGMGASFLTQTGTAGGFILVPLTGKSHSSREVLLPQIAYTTDYSTYDTMALILGTPLVVTCPPDLTLETGDITSDPPDPGEGDIITVTANVRNVGGGDANGVEVEFFDGSPTMNRQIGTTQVISNIPARGNATASLTWNLSGISGPRDAFVRIDGTDIITELDEANNIAFRRLNITSWSRMWSPPVRMTFSLNNSLEPTMVEDSNGNMWIAYHTYTKNDDWDIAVRRCRDLVCTPEDAIVTDSKRTSQPFLVADDSGNVYVIYSSNLVEWQDFISLKSGIYYWSQKFDLYSKKFNGAAWEPTVQVTASEKIDNSDQVPVATIDGTGDLWVIMRSTHYDLYEGGYQMANLPYNDMNITAASFDGMTWTTDMIVNDDAGSQGYWGGPTATTNASGTVWAAWGTEISNQQWDVFATYWTGSGWAPKMQVSLSPLNDMRPSMASDSLGRIFIAWESNRTGDKEIFMRYYDGAWSPEFQVSDDPGHDIKPTIAIDMHDNLWIAWETDRNGNKDVYLKRYNGSWSPPIQVTTSTSSDEEAFLAVSDYTDSIWVAWETDRHGDKDIYLKTLPDVLVWPDREVGRPYGMMAEMVAPDYVQLNLSWTLSKDD